MRDNESESRLIAAGYSDETVMEVGATRLAVGPDAAMFVAFYDVAVRELYRYFHRATVGDRKVAEDLVQETFMASVTAYRRGQPDAVTMPWLMGVARHKLIDHLRRVTREERKLSLAYNANSSAPVDVSFDAVDASEALNLLKSLSPAHRLVLVLRYVDDLTVAEVARLMGNSVSATESLIVRARHALEAQLNEVHDV